MEIKKVEGMFPYGIDELKGSHFYYQISETHDFDDIENLKKYGMKTPGDEILFLDSENLKVYKPFKKTDGIYYKHPVYDNGLIYFLRLDINDKSISIIKYDLEDTEEIYSMSIDGLNLGYIDLIKSPVTFYSYYEENEIFYPERLTLKKDPSENLYLRDNDKFYSYKWYEEGVDAGGVMGDDYSYYETIVVRDKESNIISEEKGSILELNDGRIIKY